MLQADARKFGTEDRWDIRVMTVDEVIDFWPEIMQALNAQPELWNGYYTLDSIFKDVMEEHMHFIACAKDGTIVLLTMCAVVEFPAAKRLQCMWMYGEGLEEAAPLLALALENFAQMCGCQYIDGYGRRGWEKFCKRFGYEFVRVHVSRPVNLTRQ